MPDENQRIYFGEFFGKISMIYLRNIQYSREKHIGLISSLGWAITLPQDKKSVFIMESEELSGDKNTLSVLIGSILLIAKKK
jgi:hypothetical protein